MRCFSRFCSVLFILVFLAGCNHLTAGKTVLVNIENGGAFPKNLAGRWQGDVGNWEITFAPDGSISSAVISMGSVEIIPGKTKTIPLVEGGKGVFRPGVWSVDCSADGKELVVRIVMDSIYMQKGAQKIVGKRTDVFAGSITNDGKKWVTEWFVFPDLYSYTSEKKKLDLNEEDSFVSIVNFTKVDTK